MCQTYVTHTLKPTSHLRSLSKTRDFFKNFTFYYKLFPMSLNVKKHFFSNFHDNDKEACSKISRDCKALHDIARPI